MHLPSQHYKRVQSESRWRKTLSYCFVLLFLPPIPFPIIHSFAALSDFNFKSVQLIARVFNLTEEGCSGGCPILWVPVHVYGISACAYVDSVTLLLCKIGISAPPPPRRNTSKYAGNQSTGPLCGPDPESYQNRPRCLHSATVYGEEVSCGMSHMLAHRFSLSVGLWASEHTSDFNSQFTATVKASLKTPESAAHLHTIYRKPKVEINPREIQILLQKQQMCKLFW